MICSLGATPQTIFSRLEKGECRFERSTVDSAVTVSPVYDFCLKDYIGRFKETRYLNRGAQFSLAAAVNAIRESKLSPTMLRECALMAGAGPNLDIGNEFPEIIDANLDHEHLKALWMLRFLPNTAASVIAKYLGIHGENATIVTACSASLQAIGEGFRKIKDGYADIVLAGGGDSRLQHGGLLAYRKAQALYRGNKEPFEALRPFDRERGGFVPGEGGAFFVLEELTHALNRRAFIHAEVCGFGTSLCGHGLTVPEPSGKWIQKAVQRALDTAKITSQEVDVVVAHGTGTVVNDDVEAMVMARLFKHYPAIIALKSWIGHLAAASGAIEMGIAIICLENDFFPEIRNLKEPCHRRLNFLRQARNITARYVVLQNLGFGGQNSALVIKKWNV